MATLVYSDVDGVDRSFSLGSEPVTVGRGAECAIRSDDPRVSRVHARFFIEQGALWIEDLGSSNGIFVGPNKVSRALVPIGEIILVGSLLIRLLPANGTLPPPIGLHGTLASWLDIERKTRAAVEEERDAFARRVGEMHHQLQTVVSARTMDPDAPELERQRDESDARSQSLERALFTLEDELAEARDKLAELTSVGDRTEWAGDSVRTANMKAGVDLAALQAAIEEAERGRSAAEHACSEALREAQVMRDELVAYKQSHAAELEAARVELGRARESRMIADTAAGVAVAERLAAADLVIAGLTRELNELRAPRGKAPTGPSPRVSDPALAVAARAEKAERELAALHSRAQGSERNLASANAARAAAEQVARDAERRADDADKRASAADTMAKAMAKDVAEALRRAADADTRARGVGRDLADALRRAEQAEARSTAGAGSARELEARAMAAEARVALLEQELAAKLEAVQQELGGKLAQTARELAAERSTALGQVDRRTQLERELADVRAQLPVLQQRAELAEREASHAEIESADARKAIEAQKARIAELEHGASAAESALGEAREQIAELERAATETGAERERWAGAVAQLADAEDRLAALTTKSDAADLAIGKAAALQRQLDEALTRLAWLERERAADGRGGKPVSGPPEAELAERIAAADTRARDAEARVGDVEGRLADAERRAALAVDAERRARDAEHRLAEIEGRLADAERRAGLAASSEQRIAAAEGKLADAEQRAGFAADLARRVADTEGKLAEMAGRVAEAERQARDTEAKLADAEGRLADATRQTGSLEESERRAAAAAAELADAEGRLADAERHAADVEGRLADAEQRAELAADAERRAHELESKLTTAEQRARTAEAGAEAQAKAIADMQEQLVALEHDLASAENVRSFAAETEREIASLQQALRDARTDLARVTLDRDHLESEVRDARGETDRRAAAKLSYDPEATAQVDVAKYESLILRSTELGHKVGELERDGNTLRRKLAEAEDRLRTAEARVRAAINAGHADEEATRTSNHVPLAALAEHVVTLEESIASLRANMRAASDETAMMSPSESVNTISHAVSQAAEHVEVARAAIRALASTIGMS